MFKCPNCGSSAQLRVIDTAFEEDGNTIEVTRKYQCGCGKRYIGKMWYESECFEDVVEDGE